MRQQLENYVFTTRKASEIQRHIQELLESTKKYYHGGTFFDYLDGIGDGDPIGPDYVYANKYSFDTYSISSYR